jgi:PIN domain nuclease of toxin-antitoxin system
MGGHGWAAREPPQDAMKLLLDTHIWIWSQLSPQRIGPKLRRRLLAEKSELWLSPISVWELLLLVERGRVKLPGSATQWVERFFEKVPVRDAALTRDVALASRSVLLPHEDPADRFLAATAAVYDLTLVTADERLLAGKGYRSLGSG